MIGWKPKSPDPRVASARIRCLNPLRELQRRGYPVELFRPERAAAYRAIVYSKLYDPASYREAAELQARGARIIVDLCDNHFYNPSGLPELVQAGSALRRMLELADHIVVSTPELDTVVRAEVTTGRPVTIIGDAIEEEIQGVRESAFRRWLHRRELQRLRTSLENSRRSGARASLVWFGIHGGPYHEHGMGDLTRVRGTLESLHQEHPLQLTVISNSREKFERLIASWALPTRYLEWSPTTFFPALRAHQIAVIPVTPNPFTRCKSSNRLATALAAGLAVVADSIPSYRPFAAVCRLDDWERGLGDYLSDERIRLRDVAAGQAVVAQHCSLQGIADAWQRFFAAVERDREPVARLETPAG